MRRDVDRTEIPGGSAYNLLDFIPDEIQAVTGGRGGWTYSGAALTAATQITAIGYHPDTAKVVATDQLHKLWDVAGATTIGTFATFLTINPTSPPAYHRGYLFFPQASTSPPAYYKSDGTVGLLAGGSPSGRYVTIYKDHTVLGGGNFGGVPSNRIWFSAPGDPTTWDTTYSWWDTTGAITGLGTTANCILIFHADSTERLRGTTPPPGSDMALEPFLPNVGCIDPFSISSWNNRLVWCSSKGIHLTDGVTMVDLTANAQMQTYWASIMSGYTSSWRISGGVFRDHYIVSINNGSSLIDCLCVNLSNQTMWRFSNLHGGSFFNLQQGQQEKLHVGLWNAGRVAELSSLWSPSGTVKQDGDGTNPTPIVETGMFRGYDRLHRRWIESMGKQKWRWGYVDYDVRDAASDNPTMTLSYCTDPAGAYTQAGLTLPETTSLSRVRRALNPTQGGATRSQMMGFKLAVTGPYASAKLYTLEGVFEPVDIGGL